MQFIVSTSAEKMRLDKTGPKTFVRGQKQEVRLSVREFCSQVLNRTAYSPTSRDMHESISL